ncbi:hypothetical protein ACFX2A_004190 [Malus domestica]
MLFSFFQEIGVGEDESRVLLDKNPAVALTSLDSLRAWIASSPRSSVDKIFDVLNKVNLYKALYLKSLEEIERTIAFFARFGGIDLIVMHPTLLNFDLKTQLVPRIGFLAELNGGDDEATGTLLGKLPAILKLFSHDNENNLAVVKNGEILISNGNGNFGADGHECNENSDGANSFVVIPHILFRDESTDIEVKQVGYGQIAARFLEKDEVPNFISRIWCEWLG